MNLEEYEFNSIEDYNDLYNYVNEKLLKDKMNYVFIDEASKNAVLSQSSDANVIIGAPTAFNMDSLQEK